MKPSRIVERIDAAAELDAAADALKTVADALLGDRNVEGTRRAVKDALHGTWLGHPLHPVLTDVAIGFLTNASVLDLLGRRRTAVAARRFVALGVLSAVPTAASGLADWSEADPRVKRTGVAHAAANALGLALYTMSWRARRRGKWATGAGLSLAGMAVLTAGGYLGGHLAYFLGGGVSRASFDAPPDDWVDVTALDELREGELVRVRANGFAVLLSRRGGDIDAIAAVCSHLGGPLEEGEVVDGCVRCPWHNSEFMLADGTVVRGPAQASQPAFDVRVDAGRVLVRHRTG